MYQVLAVDYGCSSSLQAVRQELVHLGDAGGDGEVDGAVADLDDESTDDIGVDLERASVLVGSFAVWRIKGRASGVPRW
jgi:hypothetical protein